VYDMLARRQARVARVMRRATERRTRRYHTWQRDRGPRNLALLGEAQDLMYALMEELRGASQWTFR
jgi:hypothetical protein